MINSNKNLVPSTTELKLGKGSMIQHRTVRAAFLIDTAKYFEAFRNALSKAKKSVYIIGWDIKTYTLIPDLNHPEKRIQLINLMKDSLIRNSELHIYILCWNWTSLFAKDREWFPRIMWKIRGHARLHFKLDSSHPLGSSIHQKIIVIDDAIAFCGGIDLTDHRWDTSDHCEKIYTRKDHDGKRYGPYHDIQMAVDGQAAKFLGQKFRDRWLHVKAQMLDTPSPVSDPWPIDLIPNLNHTQVLVAQTIPGEKYEVVKICIDAIDEARTFIYIENQYLSSSLVIEHLKRRLQEPDGPEIVIVLPIKYPGRFEKAVIGRLTAQAVTNLRTHDHHHRLSVYYPKLPDSNNGIYLIVHSKILIVDNRFIKVGSSNFSNRSFGTDLECDLAINFTSDRDVIQAIQEFLFQLIAEHNGCSLKDVKYQAREQKNLSTLIKSIGNNKERRLVPLEIEPSQLKKVSSLMQILVDPKTPWSFQLHSIFQKTYLFLIFLVYLMICYLIFHQ